MAKQTNPEWLPTPEIGMTVQWFPHADRKNGARALLVTGIEAAGRIVGSIFAQNSEMQVKVGIRHMEDPQHQKPNNPNSMTSGGWDYPPGTRPNETCLDLAQAEEKRREESKKVREQEISRMQAQPAQQQQLQPQS